VSVEDVVIFNPDGIVPVPWDDECPEPHDESSDTAVATKTTATKRHVFGHVNRSDGSLRRPRCCTLDNVVFSYITTQKEIAMLHDEAGYIERRSKGYT
jgi:hypothetical protein